MRGVCLIATGYATYGNWAAQLAASIHYSCPDIPICLLTDGKANSEISPDYIKHISEVIIIHEDCYTNEGMPNFLKAKTFVYDYSPFDETIFLDADMIWLPYKGINKLFDELKDLDFTMACRSAAPINKAEDTLIHWTKGKDILDKYPEAEGKTLYNLSSEVIYFKKNDKVRSFFELVKQYYLEPKVSYRDFGLQVPDELAFTLAMLHSDIKPHSDSFVPIYWEQFHRKHMALAEMYNKFYGYSAGGNVMNQPDIDVFNNLAKMYSERMNLKFYYPMRNKREFVKERLYI